MSADRETTRTVRSWLEEGVTQLPDNILDAVLDQLPATHQRRASWWPARRFQDMNTYARLAAVAAAAVIVALVGLGIATGGGLGGPGPGDVTPSEDPTPFASATVLDAASDSDLAPGSYSILPGAATPVKVTFTMPAGWDVRALEFFKHREEPGELALATWVVTHVYTDTCAAEGQFELAAIGPTVDDLVQALESLGGATVSPAVSTTVGGFPAMRVDIAMDAAIDLADCRVPALQIWANASETDFYARLPGATDSVYVVDVGGETLTITTGHMPASSEADVAELEDIIDTVRVEAQPTDEGG